MVYLGNQQGNRAVALDLQYQGAVRFQGRTEQGDCGHCLSQQCADGRRVVVSLQDGLPAFVQMDNLTTDIGVLKQETGQQVLAGECGGIRHK